MKSTVIFNFHPIVLGKLMDQSKLNQYTKFLYYHFQKLHTQSLAGDNQLMEFDEVSEQVDKYGIPSENISKRQILIFDEVEKFIETKMNGTPFSAYPLPACLEAHPDDVFGPKIGVRMEWFKKYMDHVFDEFYLKNETQPEHLIHVTCSGYSSPSVAQHAVIKRNWETTKVTHSYQMGCYGAFPAIRTGSSLLHASQDKGRVDIVHTELLSAHLNLTEFSAANTMICSLFSDGFIGYSLCDEEVLKKDKTFDDKQGMRILASHEVIIPDTLEDMSWDLGEYNFLMTLSKRVPVFIRKNIKSFLEVLCQKVGITLDDEKAKMCFAIHPGGPKIIDYVVEALGISKEQARWSYDILYRYGNMSSSTIPHVLDEMIHDDAIAPGTKVLAMAFGPGLTATALLLEKI
jgi:predicted naringenin-chalcone synthase